MPIPYQVEIGLQSLIDRIFARWPQPRPSSTILSSCKLISHRGEHNNRDVLENTVAAFDKSAAAGVWGIELDVRWTQDGVPVVHHDPAPSRLHGFNRPIAEIDRSELRRSCPLVPDLAEVVARFGSKLHLMIELKAQTGIDPRYQRTALREILSPLEPCRDYHLMALTPHTLLPFDFAPPATFAAIAYLWPYRLSRWVEKRAWGAFCAHYTMMGRRTISQHHSVGQCLGTGFIDSPNILFRELNRGVDWLFSNRAAILQKIIL